MEVCEEKGFPNVISLRTQKTACIISICTVMEADVGGLQE